MLKDPITDHDHAQGSENATVTLVEYGDYECTYCREAYPIIKQVQEYFGDNLRFVFRNFPLTEIHPLAETAAQAAELAGTEGLFWDMHNLIYENQTNLSVELLFQIAVSLEIPTEKLKEAIINHTFKEKIQKDFLGGVKSGVNGTPTLFINGHRYSSPVEFEELVAAINEFIKLGAKDE